MKKLLSTLVLLLVGFITMTANIRIVQHDKMIRYVKDGDENINNAVIEVETSASTITFMLSGDDRGFFRLYNPSTAENSSDNSLTVDSEYGLAKVELQYLGNFSDALGKTVDIVVYAGEQTETLTTTVVDMPILTFLPAKSGYRVKHTNGTELSYSILANAEVATTTQITEEGMLAVELNLATTTVGEYAFVGWQEISQDANGNEVVKYISYDQNCVYKFNGSAQVRPEFVHCSVATFCIQSQAGIAYSDFALALKDAENLYNLTDQSQVVVFESIYKIKGYTRPSDVTATEEMTGTLASGNYTIPNGVTLLIPGDDDCTCRIGDAIAADYTSSNSFVNKSKLILSEGTTITVDGNLSVYATMCYNMPYNGQPVNFGWVDMKDNAHIVANSGSLITCYGYITGNPDNSSVTANSGATIYESFQIRDWRGGTAASVMVGTGSISGDKVFPIQQYYVQNIETRLVLHYGAVERISTSANIGDDPLYPKAAFVLPAGASGSALFKLQEGTTFVKYYEPTTDRLKVFFVGENVGVNQAKATLESISLNVGVDINSSNYVLPLNNNIDVALYNMDFTISSEIAFLAGTSLYVDPKSKLTANANVFVYDADEHVVTAKVGGFWGIGAKSQTKNYFGSGNSYLTPLLKRPGDMRYDRASVKGESSGSGYKHSTDARWVIDGVVIGKIYTTAGKAEITSNGGGKISLKSGNTTLKQGIQDKIVYTGTISHSLAYLKNTSGYTQGAKDKTFVYDKAQGKWIENGTSTPVVDDKDYTPTFTLSTPTNFEAYVGKPASQAIEIKNTNNNVGWGDVDWSYQITGLSANQFTRSAVTSSRSTITFTPTSSGSAKTATLKIIASYVKNQQQYTYSKEVTLTGEATANTNDLEFAISSISSTAMPLFVGGNGAKITIDNLNDLVDYVALEQNGTDWTIAAKEGVNTTITIQATQAETPDVLGKKISKIIVVGSGKQALPLTLSVTADNFNQATWAKSEDVQFNNGVVMPKYSQWTAFFSGTPDKLKFTPTIASTWQVEEFDGKGWNVIYSWATIEAEKEFAISLTPSASKVRIRSADVAGTLTDVSITKLTSVEIKASVDTLFIPINIPINIKQNESITKSFLLTYQSENLVQLSTSNVNVLTLDAATLDPAVDNYKQQLITLTSEATTPGEYYISVKVGEQEKLTIPVIVYDLPQELPIMLANDVDKYRYYYVTSSTNYAKWDASTRKIELKNVVGSSSPSVTFAFNGAASYISFNMSDGAKGQCRVEYSKDCQNWTIASAVAQADKKTSNNNEYAVDYDAEFIRVTYESLYAESVEMSNLMIVGLPGLIVDPLQLELKTGEEPKPITITAINLMSKPEVTCPGGFSYSESPVSGEFNGKGVVTITGTVSYIGETAVTYGMLTVAYSTGTENKTAEVELTGLSASLGLGETGIMTGVNPEKYSIAGSFAYDYHNVNIANTYTKDGEDVKTLFDYLIIYGETRPATGTEITIPTATSGSNAVTPCFIYKPNSDENKYVLHKYIDNVNTGNKVLLKDEDVTEVDGSLKVYMTGFCPYASTGYTKASEGVWYFRGDEGETLDIYLEDCHIYSRNKTEDGHPFQSKEDGNSFTEGYVRGSGAVLVFECDETSNVGNPFKVNIHTRGDNLLKSNHGCFFDILGYRAYQVSSPVQIHMQSADYIQGSATELTFDDLWPSTTSNVGADTRTNGYLALKKQVNNAPSIDMGNANTVVNFRGGRVYLQNAQIVSENYQTTLAICYRSGKMGSIEFPFASGIGTDDVGGTVNFYDGTTTVEEMYVDPKYRQYYLMDEDGEHTSCLRCPQNTYIYGGSHCMIRACQHTTSKGGAPTDGKKPLGIFQYTLQDGDYWEGDETDLATINNFPDDCLLNYYSEGDSKYESVLIDGDGNPVKSYGLNSVTPNDNKLNLWLPDLECSDYEVTPEVDKNTLSWSACMTQISAQVAGLDKSVGGETYIDEDTEVQNLLYCKIDKDIYDAISAPNYEAPVKVPSTSEYQTIPIVVQREDGQDYVLQNYITNPRTYTIQDKIYYVTTATADVWQTFTAPFDVENIYVIESYSENALISGIQLEEGVTQRKSVMKAQARHNADFAAFYGVAMALYNKSGVGFWDIYNDYIAWAKKEDRADRLYVEDRDGEYNLRGAYLLEHYVGGNYATANYYLYENQGNWILSGNDDGKFTTRWEFPDVSDGILMNQGYTYSILFPYCVGCDGGKIDDREEWDYWSGKFIIFESKSGKNLEAQKHTLKGSNFVAPAKQDGEDWVFTDYSETGTEAILTGNSTFSFMTSERSELYTYNASLLSKETFYRNVYWDEEDNEISNIARILPTESFLLATPPAPQGLSIRKITRTGEIEYGPAANNPGDMTGNHVPTINGGSDIFVTSIAEGINIAVSEPQAVGVFSATGQLIYSGWVETSVNVNLVVDGVYVVVGENNSVKILY